jgi:hypothetical protein
MKKVLICGDSFSADWTVKYPGQGWPNQIAQLANVTNLSQAGCGEYKIYLQLASADLDQYDQIIVSHTSPNRIYTARHPVHHGDALHHNSDLIYTDLEAHVKTHPKVKPILDFYQQYFDLDHAAFVHNLICERIDRMLAGCRVLHITNLPWDGLYQFDNMLNFGLLNHQRGQMNHYNARANAEVFDRVWEQIDVA